MIYEVTVVLDPSIEESWVAWISDHVQEILATGCFVRAELHRVIEPACDHPTYRVQYLFDELAQLRRYEAEFAPALRADGIERFGAGMTITRCVTMPVFASNASV